MPFDSDKMTIEILPDGTIKTTTDEVSAPNHDNAESFLRGIAQLAGGECTREARGEHVHDHHHHHEDGHSHSH